MELIIPIIFYWMELHLKIKELLEKRKDLEQKDLAKILGVTPKQAHNYLNGHSKIIADNIPAIAKLLRVSINTLFDDVDSSAKSEEEQHQYKMKSVDCPECIEKQKRLEKAEKERDDFRQKYIECLEDLAGKKKAAG